MISRLTGQIVGSNQNSIVLDVNGVGYKVFVSNGFLANLNTSAEKTLTIHTYLAVRETALDLYGFQNTEEKEIFELLLTISGIGPKSAITILSSADAKIITESVTNDDATYLSKISGIGKKTAEKIVSGLKDKMGHIESVGTNTSDSGIIIDALASLGYNTREAREALKKIDVKDATDHQEVIKEALKILSNK